ncbi:MAG: hypothetical protein E6Q92_02270 [Burkholderiaceae bacterium]|nr:MAG: hypothetical protein E6Q92_02270 [Burkholderiaceae bacterium]
MSIAVSQERLDHDRALLRRLADGEGAALEVLYRRYGVEVYRHALRFRNNAAMAADATAHAFKRLMPDMSALMAPGQDVLSWLQQEAVQAEESWGVQGADDVADIGQAMPPTELGPSLLAHFYAARHRALPSSLRVVADELTVEDIRSQSPSRRRPELGRAFSDTATLHDAMPPEKNNRRWRKLVVLLVLLTAVGLGWWWGRESAPPAKPARPFADFIAVPGRATDFMKEVRGPDGQAEVRVVQTELARAELAAYGLPFDPSRAAERVPVELLLDAQGEVVALRLVEPK